MTIQERLQLYLQHRGELINYASALLSTREQAEDLVQEAWLKFEHQPLEQVQQPIGYLFRMVRNLAMDELRSQQAQQRWLCPMDQVEQLACDNTDPAHTASRRISLERLQQALDKLDEDSRLAFEMHRFGGCTLQQIAQHLGISSSSAHRLVQNAMQHCLHALQGASTHA